MSWTNRPSYPLDCGRVFDWERQKLAVDVDLRPTSGLRRPDDATPEAEHGVPRPVKLPGPIASALDKSLGAGARNMNGQFLMRGRKQPFQRMLDQKLEQVLDKPRSRAAMQGGAKASAFAKRKARQGRKLSLRERQLAAPADETEAGVVLGGKEYMGDMFSSSMHPGAPQGMVYRSRMRKSVGRGREDKGGGFDDGDGLGVPTASDMRALMQQSNNTAAENAAAAATAGGDNDGEGEDNGKDGSMPPNNGVDIWKERCALTLANWSEASDGAGAAAVGRQRALMVKEGALSALVRLSKLRPTTLRLQCAAARTLRNLATERIIAKEMLAGGRVVAALADLAESAASALMHAVVELNGRSKEEAEDAAEAEAKEAAAAVAAANAEQDKEVDEEGEKELQEEEEEEEDVKTCLLTEGLPPVQVASMVPQALRDIVLALCQLSLLRSAEDARSDERRVLAAAAASARTAAAEHTESPHARAAASGNNDFFPDSECALAFMEPGRGRSGVWVLQRCIAVATSPEVAELREKRARAAESVDGSGVATSALSLALESLDALSSLSVRALFNLTAVSHSYDGIERVMKAFVTLGAGSSAMPIAEKQVCVAALANLSRVLAWRVEPGTPRMIDEPIIDAVGHLSRRSDNFTKQVCCAVLANLAEHTPVDLMRKGGCQLAIHLALEAEQTMTSAATAAAKALAIGGSPNSSPGAGTRRMSIGAQLGPVVERQHWACLAISRCILTRSCRAQVVREGAVGALNMIATVAERAGWDGTVETVSQSLLLLASDPNTKQLIMDKGAVPILIRLAKSPSDKTREACTLGLCALLSLKDSVVYIMQQGAVGALVQLSKAENEDTRFWCASVIFNLSCEMFTAELLVREAFVPAILNLTKASSPTTIELVAATLCNLSCSAANRPRLVADGAIAPILELMCRVRRGGASAAQAAAGRGGGATAATAAAEEEATMLHCATSLACLSWCDDAIEHIVNDSELAAGIVQAIGWDDVARVVRPLLCTAFANLLSKSPRTVPLFASPSIGAIGVLVGLARIDDDVVRHCCAAAAAALSCDSPADRMHMVRAGLVPLLAHMSDRQSHSEEQQLHCARALCNLSDDAEASRLMITSGIQATISPADQEAEEELPQELSRAYSDGGPKFTFEGASSSNVVQLLMMISLVRAASVETKASCTKTLLNMLTRDTLAGLLQQGLVQLLTSLAFLPAEGGNEECLECCAQGMEILVTNDVGRAQVAGNRRALLALFGPTVEAGHSAEEESGGEQMQETESSAVAAAVAGGGEVCEKDGGVGEEGEEEKKKKKKEEELLVVEEEEEDGEEEHATGGLAYRAQGGKVQAAVARAAVQLLQDDDAIPPALEAGIVAALRPLVLRAPRKTQRDTACAFFLLSCSKAGRHFLGERQAAHAASGPGGSRLCLPMCTLLGLARADEAGGAERCGRLASARAIASLAWRPRFRPLLLSASAGACEEGDVMGAANLTTGGPFGEEDVGLLQLLCDANRGLVHGRGTGGSKPTGATRRLGALLKAAGMGRLGVAADTAPLPDEVSAEVAVEIELLWCYARMLCWLSYCRAARNRETMLRGGAVAALHAIFDALFMTEQLHRTALAAGRTGPLGAAATTALDGGGGGGGRGGLGELAATVVRALQCLSWACSGDDGAGSSAPLSMPAETNPNDHSTAAAELSPSARVRALGDHSTGGHGPVAETERCEEERQEEEEQAVEGGGGNEDDEEEDDAILRTNVDDEKEPDEPFEPECRKVMLGMMVQGAGMGTVELLAKCANVAVAEQDEGAMFDVACVLAALAGGGTRSERTAMLQRGALGTLLDIAYAATAPRTLYRVATALHHMANEPANHNQMIDNGAIAAIKHLALEKVDEAVVAEIVSRRSSTVTVQEMWTLRRGLLDSCALEAGHMLRALSMTGTRRGRIIGDGAMLVLIKFVELATNPGSGMAPEMGADLSRCCTIAFSNLSADCKLVDNGLTTAFLQLVKVDSGAAEGRTEPNAAPLPANLRPERDAKVSDAVQARGVDRALQRLKPCFAGNAAKEQQAADLWAQLEKDKVAMAAPHRAQPATEKASSELLLSRSFAPDTSGGSAAASEAKPRSKHDGSNVSPPRFGKVATFDDVGGLLG